MNYFSVAENLEEFNTILPIVEINDNDNEEKEIILKEISELMETEISKNINITPMEIMHILFGISIQKKMNYYR